MKKGLIFVLGVLSGAIATILVLWIIGTALSNSNNKGLIGATMFDKQGEVIQEKSFKVLQVIKDNAALVNGKSESSLDIYIGPIYLLINDEDKYYYDDEIIKVPAEKEVRQVGIYKYSAKSGADKTVPIVVIKDKKRK